MGNCLIWMFMVVICFLFACGRVTDKGEAKNEKRHFELPVIPAVLGSEEEKTAYLAEHYWDHFEFSDTVLLRNEEVAEQAFVDFLSLLNQVSRQVAGKCAGILLEKAWQADQLAKVGTKDTLTWALYKGNYRFDYFTEQFSHYLYEPNSPYRNDALYGLVLQQLLSLPGVPELLKGRSRYEYDNLLKNKEGAAAADFSYIGVSGEKKSLYSVDAEYVVLFFYDPDCPACRATQVRLAASEVVSEMGGKGRLVLLALCVGEDTSHWRDYLKGMPSAWLHGCDPGQEIKKRELYDLRAMPSLYLLDRDKKVVLKDALFPQLEDRLLQLR